MKRFFTSVILSVCVMSVMDVASAATTRASVQQKNVMSVGRMPSAPIKSIGVKSISGINKDTPAPTETTPDTVQPSEPEEPDTPPIDTREKERAACMQNNIGIGNTFVWASRNSDISNYATMVEDMENPENNVCFVRVDVRSSDPRVDLSDIPGKYFEMGRTIVCGSWVDEDMIEKRILDAKKKARTWATVGGAAGGAALGVGTMELFGNNLLGKAGVTSVQGQKALQGVELLRSQLLVLKNEKPKQYEAFIANLRNLRDACGNSTDPRCTEFSGIYDLLD